MAESEAPQRVPPLVYDLLVLVGGAVFTLALSPFDYWPLAFLSPALLFLATRECSTRRATLRFYLFNIAFFGTGVSWIWVSVHVHGNAGVLLATFLVGLLVVSYSLLCLPLAWVYSRFFRRDIFSMVLGFCCLWVVQEWLRVWVLTGFPWLYLGYGVMNTPLVSLAPIVGIFGVSLAVVIVATTLTLALLHRNVWLVAPSLTVIALSGVAANMSFTEKRGELNVSLIQGNIDQHQKWRRAMRGPIMRHFVAMSSDEWGQDLIVWPEAAITTFKDDAMDFLEELDAQAKSSDTAVFLGIPDRSENGRFQNTVIALGTGEGQYIKRRLVPFGEYVPLENVLRGLIDLFDLPMARNETGPRGQPPLSLLGYQVATLICYEIVYPSLVRSSASDPDFLLTVSNDTWFGRSIGPHQHLQMARMRAIELGRDLVRGTNNGVTAVVDAQGIVKGALPQFEAAILRQTVDIRTGRTPYAAVGDLPVLSLCALGLLIVVGRYRLSR